MLKDSSLGAKIAGMLVGLALVLSLPWVTHAQMSSVNYGIPWDTISSGGDEGGASTNYRVADTIGGQALDIGASASYKLEPGYRAGDERPLGFEIAFADVNGASYAYSSVAFSRKEVTLASLADAAHFSVGDYVALQENPGLSQLVTVGKVRAISGAILIVDRFDGNTNTMSASPSSGRVVRLTTNVLSFGQVTVASGAIATGLISVVADTDGYTMYLQSNGPPISGANTIHAVSDGMVVAGTEEYGMRFVGTTAQSAESDISIDSSAGAVQSSSTSTANPADRVGMMYKLAIASQTPTGSYAQSLFFTLTPHY